MNLPITCCRSKGLKADLVGVGSPNGRGKEILRHDSPFLEMAGQWLKQKMFQGDKLPSGKLT
jgi:hypothetical protein